MTVTSEDQQSWHNGKFPALVAHRGYATRYPENTLESIRAAVAAGVGFIEFDVQLSKDGVPFLMHDDNFNRTGALDLNVFDLTMSEIELLCVGDPKRFGAQFSNVRPIRLNSLCEQLNNWPEVHSFIEIKRQSLEHFGVEYTVEKVLQGMATLKAHYILLSFSEACVRYLRELQDHRVGWVIRDWNSRSLDVLAELQPDYVFCNQMKIGSTDLLPQGDWSWVIYEITSVHSALHWRKRGAAMVESMDVGQLVQYELFAGVARHGS